MSEAEIMWEQVGRPGYLGKHRDEKFAEWDKLYGKGNWRLAWKVGTTTVDFLGACALYEDAYFEFLRRNPEVLDQLVREASDVYDDELSNIESRFDYTRQETKRTHIQDIAIRRSVLRFGLWFAGKEPIRIRQEKGNHPLSMTLSPGRVLFHRPDLIEPTRFTESVWWNRLTVEDFYQSNRVLIVRYSPAV